MDKGTVLGKLTAKSDLLVANRTFRTTVERDFHCEVGIKILHFTWPQALCGQMIRLNVDGDVDATVDHSKVSKSGVEVDGDTVRISLPAPHFSEPWIDNVDLLTDDRGLADRFGDVFSKDTEQSDAVIDQGKKQIVDAAEQDQEFEELARKQADKLLSDLLQSAGVDKVQVTFMDPQ